MTEKEGERLARVETKLDTLAELIKSYFETNNKSEERLRTVEQECIKLKTTHEEALKNQQRNIGLVGLGLAALQVILKWGIK
jgi:hypothetical protein